MFSQVLIMFYQFISGIDFKEKIINIDGEKICVTIW